MKRHLRILPVLVLAGLAACGGSDDDSATDTDNGKETTGSLPNPTAIAVEIAPPTGGRLPAELLPPSE